MDAPIFEAYDDPTTDSEYFEELASHISAAVEENGGIAGARDFLQKEIRELFETYVFRAAHAELMLYEAEATLNYFSDRIDPFVFSELAGELSDHPVDHGGEDQVVKKGNARDLDLMTQGNIIALQELAKDLRDLHSEYSAAEIVEKYAKALEENDV